MPSFVKCTRYLTLLFTLLLISSVIGEFVALGSTGGSSIDVEVGNIAYSLSRFIIPAFFLAMIGGIILLVAGNRNGTSEGRKIAVFALIISGITFVLVTLFIFALSRLSF